MQLFSKNIISHEMRRFLPHREFDEDKLLTRNLSAL